MKLFIRAFWLSDTHGLPLAVQLAAARERGFAVSLPHFYRDALAAGWKPARALAKVEEALVDAHASREYIDAALAWLTKHEGKLLPEEA